MAPSAQTQTLAPIFNPNKKYDTCHGDANFAYEQNGFVYNGKLEAVDSATGKRIPMVQGPPIELIRKNKGPALPQQRPRDIDDEDVTEDEKPLDLVAWRDGELPGTLWPIVVAAVKKQCGRTPSSKVEAIEMINKKWPPDQEPELPEEA